MSDNPSPIPIPDDFVVVPNQQTQRFEAIPRVAWDEAAGCFRMQMCLPVADARTVMFSVPGKPMACALVVMEADGTLSPEKCRAGLVEIGVRKADG